MRDPDETKAVLRGGTPPSEENRKRLLDFLRRTYGPDPPLAWRQDDALAGGFVPPGGGEVSDWSGWGR